MSKKTLAENIIGFKELRLNASKYIAKVKKGESFLVMQRSTPIFKMTPVDEWGDEGVWSTVLNFSKTKRGGIPIEKIIERFKKIKKNESSR